MQSLSFQTHRFVRVLSSEQFQDLLELVSMCVYWK